MVRQNNSLIILEVEQFWLAALFKVWPREGGLNSGGERVMDIRDEILEYLLDYVHGW